MTQILPPRTLSGDEVTPLPAGLRPSRSALEGRWVRLEPVEPDLHCEELFTAAHGEMGGPAIWTYLPYGPFPDLAAFTVWLRDCAATADPIFFAVRELGSGKACGMMSYLNIAPKNGSIEIGHIWLAPRLQRTRAATEALFLLMRQAFGSLAYRRLEWKCNALNEASRRAALRLGFVFEGVFYQHMIVKGRNRDSAWFSLLDREWPLIRTNFEAWLSPGNFHSDGTQRESLAEMNRRTRQNDPAPTRATR